MVAFKTYHSDYDFSLDVAETDTSWPGTTYVFLSLNLMVEKWIIKNDDGDEDDENMHIHAIIENPKHGLMQWNNKETCWEPVDEDVQKAYSDYCAEQEILKK